MREEGLIPETNIFVCRNTSCRQPIFVEENLLLRKPTEEEAHAARYKKASTGRWVKRAKAPSQSGKFSRRKPESQRFRRPSSGEDTVPIPGTGRHSRAQLAADEDVAAAIEAAKAMAEGEETIDNVDPEKEFSDFCEKQKVFIRTLIDRGVKIRWKREDGKWVPRFAILKEIGEGATAIVALAIDMRTGKKVVLKFGIASAYPGDEGLVSRKRTMRSFEIQKGVDSAHVLEPITLIAQDPDPASKENLGYIYVEPFVDGYTIKQVIDRLKIEAEKAKIIQLVAEHKDQEAEAAYAQLQKEWGTELVSSEWRKFRGHARVIIHTTPEEERQIPPAVLPEEVAITVMLQILGVLQQFKDGDGVVHRDIKPHNVIFMSVPCTYDDQGNLDSQTAVLLDFGEARRWSDPRDHRSLLPGERLSDDEAAKRFETLTQNGVIRGTPHYMAPEQVCGERLGWWTDLYALCAMVYHMVTGGPMFSGDNVMHLVNEVLNTIPESARKRAEEQGGKLSLEFTKIIHRGLEKRKDERFQSLEEVITALKACRDSPNNYEDKADTEPPSEDNSSGLGSVIRRWFRG